MWDRLLYSSSPTARGGDVLTPPPAPGALPTQGGGEYALCPFPPEEPHPGEPRFHLRRLQLAALHPSAPLRRRILTPIHPRGSSVPGKIKTNHIWKTYLHQKNAGETSSCAQAGTAAGEHRSLAPLAQAAERTSPRGLGYGFGIKGSRRRDVGAGEIKEQPPAQLRSRDARSGLWLSVSAWVGSGHRLGLEETAA